ncbi:hypothetical protein SAMN06297144_1625 [Sphingomonas guangdongensis]|uniref:Uncharacterized protein n=1 Tax=Sphingomonas guangdongensis TaxID=1141890 RepID=A0A285QYS0_9SPHN|nr:hypothetical protein [Sphingomonas guangdongensis]SOB86519.1 hypothetical protein SAMN06297144_1625 [Sphingomonas guangdongensis]
MDALGDASPAVARPGRVPALLCAALGHRPDGPAIWNSGHGFARCNRCGRAIVRTIVHGWRLPPPGYRIRWPDDLLPASTAEPPTPADQTAARDFMADRSIAPGARAFDFDTDFGPAGRQQSPRRRSTP